MFAGHKGSVGERGGRSGHYRHIGRSYGKRGPFGPVPVRQVWQPFSRSCSSRFRWGRRDKPGICLSCRSGNNRLSPSKTRMRRFGTTPVHVLTVFCRAGLVSATFGHACFSRLARTVSPSDGLGYHQHHIGHDNISQPVGQACVSVDHWQVFE